MFRTRDFILIFTSIVFLLMAITATAISRQTGESSAGIQFGAVSDTDSEAVIEAPESRSRAERLADMRQKIAESNEIISAPEPAVAPVEETDSESESESAQILSEVLVCDGYAPATPVWSPADLVFEEVESARLIYRPIEITQEILNASGTVVGTETVIQKDIALQLPVRSARLAQDYCLPSDVVGIAQDGSLIRNTEVGLYSVFGPETLIGYALDGFPIYGSLPGAPVDSCGGLMAPTGYRYHLTPEREAIVYCFGGPPVQI